MTRGISLAMPVQAQRRRCCMKGLIDREDHKMADGGAFISRIGFHKVFFKGLLGGFYKGCYWGLGLDINY